MNQYLLEAILQQLQLSNLFAIEFQIQNASRAVDKGDASPIDVEIYLNAMDRLCRCVLKGAFDERETRTDYETCIYNAFEILTEPQRVTYNNICELALRWRCSGTTT